jgi:hypothetical protein
MGMGAVLLVALVVGSFFGYVAGNALALGVLTIFLLGFGMSAGVGMQETVARSWGEKLLAPTPPSAGSTSGPSFTRL